MVLFPKTSFPTTRTDWNIQKGTQISKSDSDCQRESRIPETSLQISLRLPKDSTNSGIEYLNRAEQRLQLANMENN